MLKLIATVFIVAAFGNGETEQTNLIVLGTVGGKSYFGNGKALKNWSESKAYCENNGMQLAKISSLDEEDFLKTVYDPLNFNGWFWIQAKYSEKTNNLYETRNSMEDCLCYSSNIHEHTYYFRRACHHFHHILCESTRPIWLFNGLFKNHTNPQPKLIDIGSLDGKTYFGDQVLRNWNDSKSHCEKNGFQLATLNNRNRGSFLKSACFKINFDGLFWVLGKEGHLDLDNLDNKCPRYVPHHDSYHKQNCSRKYFTLCEILEPDTNSKNETTESTLKIVTHVHLTSDELDDLFNWDSAENYEEEDFENGIEEEDLDEKHQLVAHTTTDSCNSSHIIYVSIIIVLIAIIGGLMIRQTNIWNRIFRPTFYFSVKEFSPTIHSRDTSQIDLVSEDP